MQRPAVGMLLVLLLSRAVANVLLWQSGFAAISDDDFARVVIAQRFAEAPGWDPSGSSWLPFPFWLMGGTFLASAPSLESARALSFVLSLVGTALHFLAARWLGLNLAAAFVGALLASLLPHSLWLGLATVPDGYHAALCVLALASSTRFTLFQRAMGGGALLIATLCRYESWPLAVAFAGLTLWDTWRGKLPRFGGIVALLPTVGMAAWLLHGAINHDNALFFLTRVADYKRALGESAPWFEALLTHPSLLLRAEPELVLALGLTWRFLVWRKVKVSGSYLRPVLLCAGLFLFLIVGNTLGGAATHHVGRTLLTLWLCAALWLGDAVVALGRDKAQRIGLVLVLGVTFALLTPLRRHLVPVESFVDRSREVAIGRLAREAAQQSPGLIAIDCDDFGYNAVIAGIERPSHAFVLRSHDPRLQELRSLDALSLALRQSGARWLVSSSQSPLQALDWGTVEAQQGGFVLRSLAAPTTP